MTASKGEFKPALWTPGDWNALFGFGTNILVNMLVLTGLLRFVLKMPDSLVFGRILPALGLMMCLSTFYYAWLAYRLAQKTGRNDVCALPSGVSVPHMFIVTFVIMLPITLKTGDPIKGWSAGLVWVFFQSFILMIGGFIAPYIRKVTPRAALLGTLAGVSVTFISMRPALEMYMTPQIGLVCFAIILASWFGGVRYPKAIPAGLVAIAAGMLIAWGSNLFGLGLGGLSVKGLGDAFANFGFSVPIPALGEVFSGFEFLGIILVTAIPFGIYEYGLGSSSFFLLGSSCARLAGPHLRRRPHRRHEQHRRAVAAGLVVQGRVVDVDGRHGGPPRLRTAPWSSVQN